MNKVQFLNKLYYNLGKQFTNFRVFHNYIGMSGEKHFSKWVYFLDAEEKDIEKATHRTLLVNEIVLDFDPVKDETFDHLTKKVKKTCFEFKQYKLKYLCFFTGSRGYHIHVFLEDLFYMSKEERRTFRVNMSRFYGSELQKNSEDVAIALEGVFHWKSGKPKTRCFW